MASKSNQTKAAVVTAAPAAAIEERRGYEVLGTLNLGRIKGELEVRTAGEIVYADELEPEMLQYLLKRGEIADRNKPIPPSQAEGVFAFDHLVDVGKEIGAVVYANGKYRVAGADEQYAGLIAFRAAVSIAQLKAAIVTKANG